MDLRSIRSQPTKVNIGYERILVYCCGGNKPWARGCPRAAGAPSLGIFSFERTNHSSRLSSPYAWDRLLSFICFSFVLCTLSLTELEHLTTDQEMRVRFLQGVPNKPSLHNRRTHPPSKRKNCEFESHRRRQICGRTSVG